MEELKINTQFAQDPFISNEPFISKEPFISIPNSLISLSCTQNHTILPIYLYSWTHSLPAQSHLVDTNLSLFSETFDPYSDTSKAVPSKFRDALKVMGTDLNLIKYRVKLDNIKPTTRIQYYFLPRTVHIASDFTKILYSEYNFIVDYFYQYNVLNKLSSSKERSLNAQTALCLFCYMKMKITQFEAYSTSFSKFTMNESITTIAKTLNIGNRTTSKYLKILFDIGLIDINNGQGWKKQTESVYTLSDKWKNFKLKW